MENKKVIALAGNSNYIPHILTTIKSICVYNHNIKFYLFNRDISTSFFTYLNRKLALFNSEVVDIKITRDEMLNYKTYKHINSDSTFFRYFIPDYVSEDKVLYLDSDLVVNGPLDNLFELDLSNYYLAAVKDNVADVLYNKSNEFNAGVMLINNKLWRESGFTTDFFIKISNKYINKLPDADQSILNQSFEDLWFKLHRGFNYLVGGDYLFKLHDKSQYIEELGDNMPVIVHFNTAAKPWLEGYDTRFRELYWYYFGLEFDEILRLQQE